MLQSILSLDSNLLTKAATMGTKPSDLTATPSPTTAPVNETTTTLTSESPSTPATNSPKADEPNGRIGSSKSSSSSSSLSAASASKIDGETNATVKSSGSNDLIGNNRIDNDTGTANDVNNKHHESDEADRNAASVSGESFLTSKWLSVISTGL